MTPDDSLKRRPRRNRKNAAIRALCSENRLHSHDLVWPIFLCEGEQVKEELPSLPYNHRMSLDSALECLKSAQQVGIRAAALFPAIEESLKDSQASEALNQDGLIPRALRFFKKHLPDMLFITDIALDPYSSDGHDGLVKDGKILNDPSLPLLSGMACLHAEAGADFVAPSDMMDGRIGHIRKELDLKGYEDVGIISYTAKYCSAFYGPFRSALNSAPKAGDKKTYQMNPANKREALLEMELDIQEGADALMVKPAQNYLDIIHCFKEASQLPIAAYHVSGEYAMLAAASEKGLLDLDTACMEVLHSIKRAGADMIFTYYALEAAKKLKT